MHRLAILASLFATAAAAQVQPITPAQFPACEASVPAGQKALCVVEVIKAPAPPPVEPPPAPPPPPPPPPPAPPPPPPPAPPPSPGGYDLAAAHASLPAHASKPQLAEASRATVNYSAVRNSAELAVALSQAARRIACVPGSNFTQAINITRADTLLDMEGCRISDGRGANILGISAPRVTVLNGTWDGGFEVRAGGHDAQIRRAAFNGRAQGASNQVMDAQRVLLEGLDVLMQVSAPGAVGLWSQRSSIVIANSRWRDPVGGQATIRTHATSIAVMDSYVQNITHHTLRAHADGVPSPYVAWVRNVVQGGWIQAWGGPGDPVQVSDHFIIGNAFHANATGFYVNYPSSTRATITGNQVFNGGGGFSWPTGPGWTVSGNTSAPYRAAPAWSIK